MSRVINNNYYVDPEKTAKVVKAIQKLNYFPNAIARSLKNDSTYMIGYIVSDISNNYFATLAKTVEEVVNPENYNIMIFSSDHNSERERAYLNLLIQNKVDGIIINTSGNNDDFIATISNSIPVVSINRRVKHGQYSGDFIDSDNFNGGYMLGEHLLSFGHNRIGVINGDQNISTGRERYEGFLTAMKKYCIPVEDWLSYNGRYTVEGGYKGAEYFISSYPAGKRPSALIAMNNDMAIGALKYFIDNKINIPEDVSIASYGNINNIELLYVQPSYVTLNPGSIGVKCGELLLDRIKNKKNAPREVICETVLIPGNGVVRVSV